MRRFLVLLKNIISLPLRMLTHVSIFAILQDTEVDKTAAISFGVKFYRSKLGKYSYINRGCFITDTEIGNYCSIAMGCQIGGTSHPLDWVSTSPVFHKWENIMKKNFSRHEFMIFQKTKIGNDVWIGTNTLIKAGVTIADGAVIGMGSIVTKDIGPYEIWVGNPAKMIKKRFNDETIEKLLKLQWWNWDDDLIKQSAQYFNNVNKFLNMEGSR